MNLIEAQSAVLKLFTLTDDSIGGTACASGVGGSFAICGRDPDRYGVYQPTRCLGLRGRSPKLRHRPP
jgi:hypothetical protein